MEDVRFMVLPLLFDTLYVLHPHAFVTCWMSADEAGYRLDRKVLDRPYQEIDNLVTACNMCKRCKGRKFEYAEFRQFTRLH